MELRDYFILGLIIGGFAFVGVELYFYLSKRQNSGEIDTSLPKK